MGIRTTPGGPRLCHCPAFSPASVADADQAPNTVLRAHCGHSPAKYSVLHCSPIARPGSWHRVSRLEGGGAHIGLWPPLLHPGPGAGCPSQTLRGRWPSFLPWTALTKQRVHLIIQTKETPHCVRPRASPHRFGRLSPLGNRVLAGPPGAHCCRKAA